MHWPLYLWWDFILQAAACQGGGKLAGTRAIKGLLKTMARDAANVAATSIGHFIWGGTSCPRQQIFKAAGGVLARTHAIKSLLKTMAQYVPGHVPDEDQAKNGPTPGHVCPSEARRGWAGPTPLAPGQLIALLK
ncbi:hypothetical protein NDU88_005731 [Pleurodeles waltl]|uniref:Uncharacterized protein n=1 Tax=Pleurodeles waltl TaxID=8319 RepID=A0AAV7UK29_PLEWA|nr:hypothetical protein NDU88_005731 [Pleurodeles waltl]